MSPMGSVQAPMADPATILVICGTFVLAGTVKGIIGLGLPTVSLALLTVAIDLTSAMALLIVPSLVTNIWQAVIGRHAKDILRCHWPFFLMAALTVWIGAQALVHVSLSWLSALLGTLLMVYSSASLTGRRWRVAPGNQTWVGIVAGSINGILTGMTGSFVVPGVMYLQAIDLSRDALIQAMGMLFTVSTLALAVALQRNDMLTVEHGMLSLAALVPAIAGMLCGQQIRKTLPEPVFRKVFFISLLILGTYILIRSLGGSP